MLLLGNSQSIEIKADNGSGVFTVTLTRSRENNNLLYESRRPEWRVIISNDDCRVGIVNMGELETDQVEEMFNDLWDTDALIFDIRNYPRGTLWHIVNYLYPSSIHIANFTTPDITYPGRLYWNPAHIGSGTSTPYPGKVIILFDERTLSQAEYTVMGLEQFPDAIKIGNTTAAADGNVSQILLPGKITTYATFLGTYYPDYTPTQRIGIIPDFEVHPTISGIRSGNDELLEFAFEYLNCDLITAIQSEIGLIKSEIRLYPNPVSYILNYEIDKKNYIGAIEFEISDIQGRRIKTINNNTASGKLDLANLKSGIYIIKILTSNGILSKKIIKN
jgi:C-terminal processing protease CtpA/Prc